MALTPIQLVALKADIAADPVLSQLPNNFDSAYQIMEVLNAAADPAFYVWRTNLPQYEIVSNTSPEATVWSWTAYIGRSVGERDAWREMFADTGAINPSLLNVRQGLSDIFSGTAGAAQRTHLLAIGKRTSLRIEKILATGTGSQAVPATMGYEGAISVYDVKSALDL